VCIDRSCALESVFRGLWIHTLKAQLALRKHICASLAAQFENPNSKSARRTRLAYLWDETTKEVNLLQLFSDLLEREEREKRGNANFGATVQ
jgi:hypothetical protein